ETMRLPPSPHREPLEQVIDALSEQPSLLVLDNFEHLVEEGAPMLRRLLGSVPTLSALVTSRQRLNLEGERELPVPPLPVPSGVDGRVPARSAGELMVDGSGDTPVRSINHQLTRSGGYPTIHQNESVQLFLDRAQAARPDFQI